ncbi:MAG: DUF4037 domain-containing protein [Ardenticatenaceae bacterium]
MAEFIPGLELAAFYYDEAVKPILLAHYPRLVHSAGLIGSGSEVLGFDTAMSADHNWGPRVVIYLSDEDHVRLAEALRERLAYELPFTFRGYATHFDEAPDDPGTVLLGVAKSRPINHCVEITTLGRFIRRYIGIELEQETVSVMDWLTIPEQRLRTIKAGAVFHDGLNVLEPMRRQLAYYPHDVWLYLLSAQWGRIGQEEAFVGRAGIVGDEVGSAVIAARLVRDLMRLCLLMEKQYAPYPKWFGSAFAQLSCAPRLTPIFERVLRAKTWPEREKNLTIAYELVATMHNELQITESVVTQVSPFHNRPFMVIQGGAIASRIWDAIEDEQVKALPHGVGKVDQYVDSTDVLSNTERFRKLSALYAV